MAKKKILLMSDDLRMHSGVATVSKDIVIETLNELGGVHTIEDFENQKTIFSESLSNSYKGNIIHQCPPNGPGITVLIMMAILEKFDFNNVDPMSSKRFHYI